MANKKLPHSIDNRKLAKYVRKAQTGDKKAFEHIVNETKDYIYYYALTLLCDEEEALEAVQDIYVILLKKLDTIDKPQAFLGWLKVVTANYCKNRLSRTKQYISIDDEVLTETEETVSQLMPQECIETDEIKKIILSAIKTLPVSQRECILMHYYQQMSINQIAEILDIKEGTVKSRLFNGRKSIKAELEKYGKEAVTFGGFSPMAYITYCLLKDSENCGKVIDFNSFIDKNTILNTEIPVDPMTKLSSVVHTIPVTAAKTAFSVKTIVAVATASVLATGGIVSYTVKNSTPVSQTETSNTQMVTEPSKPRIIIDELYYANGLTDEDRKKDEVLFDENAELNSLQNKDYVYDRMLNSIDYFKTLKATYYYSDAPQDDSVGMTYYSTYCIDQTDGMKSKELKYSGDGKLAEYFVYDGKVSASINIDDEDISLTKEADFSKELAEDITAVRGKTFTKRQPLPNSEYVYKQYKDYEESKSLDFVALADSKKRIKYSKKDGEDVIYSRINTPLLTITDMQYFPQNVATNYLVNFDNWEINSTANVLGRECLVISGLQNKNNVSAFEIIIDKATGAMVAFSGYDSEGNLTAELITTEFSVDSIIDDTVFDDLSAL